MDRFPHMTKIRKGIPKWVEERAKMPFMEECADRMHNFAQQTIDKGLEIGVGFDPLPTIVFKNPWTIEDKVQMNLIFQWGIVDKDGNTHQHYSDVVEFSNNPYNNPQVETQINETYYWSQVFPMFHIDWRTQIYRMDSNYNLKTTHDSKYDATSKNVYMYIHSNKPNQVNTWIDSCLEYKEKHNCNLYLNLGGTYDQASVRARQENNDGFTEVKSRSEIGDVYASYYIGYGDKNLFGYGLFGDYGNFNPFNKYLGEDNIGFNPMGNSLIYSALNPRDPNVLSDKQIADDILGLSDWDYVYGC
jgi:hypothetical protein